MEESPNQRLRKARKLLGLNQEQMGERLGLEQASYSAVETGKNDISSRVMKLLIQKFQINPNYIYLGYEPVFLPSDLAGTSTPEAIIASLRAENEGLKALLTEKEDQIKIRQEMIDLLKRQLEEQSKKD